jgi:hypothetical protein
MQVRVFNILVIAGISLLVSTGCLDGPVKADKIQHIVININLWTIESDSVVLTIEDDQHILSLDSIRNGTQYLKSIHDTVTGTWQQDTIFMYLKLFNQGVLTAEWTGYLVIQDDSVYYYPKIYPRMVDDLNNIKVDFAHLYYTVIDSPDTALEFTWERYDNLKDDFGYYYLNLTKNQDSTQVWEAKIEDVGITSIIITEIDLSENLRVYFQVFDKKDRTLKMDSEEITKS